MKITITLITCLFIMSCGSFEDYEMHTIELQVCNLTDHDMIININSNEDQVNASYADSINMLKCNKKSEVNLGITYIPGKYYVIGVSGVEKNNAYFTMKYSVTDSSNNYIFNSTMNININNSNNTRVYILQSPLKHEYTKKEMRNLLKKITTIDDKMILLGYFTSYNENYTFTYSPYSQHDFSINLYDEIGPLFNKYNIEVEDYILCYIANY